MKIIDTETAIIGGGASGLAAAIAANAVANTRAGSHYEGAG